MDGPKSILEMMYHYILPLRHTNMNTMEHASNLQVIVEVNVEVEDDKDI
jgi:hypothetical protein